MKAISILIVCIVIAATTSAQQNNMRTTMDQPLASVVKTDFKKTEKFAYHSYSTGECAKYHKMKVAGIVLSAVGGAMVITGGAMVAIDNRNTELYGKDYYGRYHPLRGGGGAMAGLGLLSMGAGIPLAIVGGVKGHKYCGASAIPPSQSYLELHSGDYGTGLALKF